MSGTPRTLFIAMTVSFAICILGLVFGMCYALFEYFFRHREFWGVLSASIPFYRILGGIGIAGMALFFAFLVSLTTGNRR